MAGSVMLRSAYHQRLVGYGDFLRNFAADGAGSADDDEKTSTEAPRAMGQREGQHSCHCGICDACNDQPANTDWLPSNYWGRTGHAGEALTQREQVSQITSSFKLDEDRELISAITAKMGRRIKRILRHKHRSGRQANVKRTLEVSEALYNAGLLSEGGYLHGMVTQLHALEAAWDAGTFPPPAPATSSESLVNGAMRFSTLLTCTEKVDKMISDGEITEAERQTKISEYYTNVLEALEEELKAKEREKERKREIRLAHVSGRKEKERLAAIRAANSIHRAAYGREPKVRSQLSGEVWIASPPKPTSKDATADQKANIQLVTVESKSDSASDSDAESINDNHPEHELAGESSQHDDDDGDDEEEEVILFKGRRRR